MYCLIQKAQRKGFMNWELGEDGRGHIDWCERGTLAETWRLRGGAHIDWSKHISISPCFGLVLPALSQSRVQFSICPVIRRLLYSPLEDIMTLELIGIRQLKNQVNECSDMWRSENRGGFTPSMREFRHHLIQLTKPRAAVGCKRVAGCSHVGWV